MALMLTSLLASGLLLADRQEATTPVTKLQRNTYGRGRITRTLRIVIDGTEQKEPVEITVDERMYTREEMEKVFERAIKKLETLMLGKNESLDLVQTDLNLITEIPGEPVAVSWELDRYDLMNIYGELNEEKIEELSEGTLIQLKAYLTYTEDESMEAMRAMSAMVYPPRLSEDEQKTARIERVIEKEEQSSREEGAVILPSEVEGEQIELRNPDNPRGWYVLALGPVICLLLVSLERQNDRKQEKERAEQMMRDYPEIINKLALLLGAGMTVKKAWQKIIQDYERRKEEYGSRYAYEEMAAACREMQRGVTETESYERFGKRCGLKAYRKLASLLIQNLRKGTKGLAEMLKGEAVQAFEERKAAAKRQGEEAGTKLLAPMFLMLAMVLVLVIVPAFLSIQM